MDLEQAKKYILDNRDTKKSDLQVATTLIVPESEGKPFFGISSKSGNIAYGMSTANCAVISDERLIEIVALVR